MSLYCLDWHLGVPDEHPWAWRWPRVGLPKTMDPAASRVARQGFVTVILEPDDDLKPSMRLAGCTWEVHDVWTGEFEGTDPALYVVYRRTSAPSACRGGS